MEQFKVIGYYICGVIDTPEWLNEVGKQVLSVSGCIGEQHPKWECFMGGWRKGESQEYQNFLKLDDAQYREFTDAANHLFDLKRIDVDCRFLQLPDAQYFHKRFCSAINSRVVSVSTTPKYFEILKTELKGSNSETNQQVHRKQGIPYPHVNIISQSGPQKDSCCDQKA